MRAVIFAVLLGAGVAHAQPTADRPAPPPEAEPAPAPPAEPAAPDPAPAPTPEPAPAPVPAAPPAEAEAAPTDPTALATPLPAMPESVTPSRNKDVAWLLVGGAITFATAGTVLAYSTTSAEQDLKDLYVTSGSNPPRFDASTRRRYDDLVDEGERYQLLSILSFGIAGACAAGAGYFFWRSSQESTVTVTPVVTPTSAGVSVRF